MIKSTIMDISKLSLALRLLIITGLFFVLLNLEGCSSSTGRQSVPSSVPTVLPSGEKDWPCQGVPSSVVRPIVGGHFDSSETYINDSDGDLKTCYVRKMPKVDGGSFVSIKWGGLDKLKGGADYSLTGDDSIFVNNDANFTIEGVRGKGAVINSSPRIVVAAWDCAAPSLSGRGIIVDILYDSQQQTPRDLSQDAVNMITLVRPWACGETSIPGNPGASPTFEVTK